jgi:hypothetical protein
MVNNFFATHRVLIHNCDLDPTCIVNYRSLRDAIKRKFAKRCDAFVERIQHSMMFNARPARLVSL